MEQETTVIINTRKKRFDLMPWRNQTASSYYKEIGTIVEIDRKHYIITCFHGVKNVDEINFYSFKREGKSQNYKVVKKQGPKLEKLINAPELDISLIPLSEQESNKIQTDSFNPKLPNIGETVFMTILNTQRVNQNIKIIRKEFSCKILKISFESIISFHRTKIPILHMDTEKIICDYPDLTGISGSLVINTQKEIVGIISHIQQLGNTLAIIPSCFILRFIKEFQGSGNFRGLCSIVGRGVPACITDPKKHGYMMLDTYSINYNYSPTSTSEPSLGDNLRNLDLITKIDEQTITESGELYDECCSIQMPLETFIALNYFSDEMISLQLYRTVNGKNYKRFRIKLKARPVSTTCYLREIFDGRYLEIAGLIFIELSEDMLDFFEDLGYHLIGSVQKYRQLTPYRNRNRRVVVWIDIIHDKFSEDQLRLLQDKDLPLRNVFNQDYNLPIITKIDTKLENKQITNLDQLQILLTENCTIYGSLSEFLNVKIIIENGNIKTVQMYGKKSRNKL